FTDLSPRISKLVKIFRGSHDKLAPTYCVIIKTISSSYQQMVTKNRIQKLVGTHPWQLVAENLKSDLRS
ncbi:MAG: hypothetical protein Q8Q05_02475, partial [bacterium]|nr:hypothetical protein [bacterium]